MFDKVQRLSPPRKYQQIPHLRFTKTENFNDSVKNTCLWRVLSRPGVRPVSVFCVATFISNRSLTGRHSPLDSALKYLGMYITLVVSHLTCHSNKSSPWTIRK